MTLHELCEISSGDEFDNPAEKPVRLEMDSSDALTVLVASEGGV